ncbi:MAG: peptide chain release factor N(5)-glutamine methyltransferase [Gammaproteobacteria bacterium]|jgi:release factor glutamine methyltransferase
MNGTAEGFPLGRLLETAAARLPDSGSARLEAEVLLGHVISRPRSYLYTWPERHLAPDLQARFERLLQRRVAGEPVAYITGRREFWSLPLAVTPATLIPRPETETLVSLALERIPANAALEIADLGTGSGAIALAIARERPRCRLVATDISTAALAVARQNAARLGIGNIRFLAGDWFEPLADAAFDFVLSNPPYVPESAPQLSEGDVRFEPHRALASGPDGMEDLARIAHAAGSRLRSGGRLLLEHGYDQGTQATRLLHAAGYHEISDHVDSSGNCRVVVGRK